MKKITLDDITALSAYEKLRESFRQRVIELKKKRRVSVGEKVSLVFENRETVIFQIQEMLRAEKITDLEKIREEIDVYNSLIPDTGELSATLFLELENQNSLREELLKFLGVDEFVFFKIGNHSIRAIFEEGHSKEDKISAVQYVRFPFRHEQIEAFDHSGLDAALVIDHPYYRAKAAIDGETRKSLAEDLKAQENDRVQTKRRNTRQLDVIWEAVKDESSHPTADQIFDKVRAVIPNVSLGTVYRNLQKLVAQGKLQVLTLGRTQHFDPMVQRHEHVICQKCGQVYDVFVDNREEIFPASLPHEGFTVTSHELAFYGTCKLCSD